MKTEMETPTQERFRELVELALTLPLDRHLYVTATARELEVGYLPDNGPSQVVAVRLDPLGHLEEARVTMRARRWERDYAVTLAEAVRAVEEVKRQLVNHGG